MVTHRLTSSLNIPISIVHGRLSQSSFQVLEGLAPKSLTLLYSRVETAQAAEPNSYLGESVLPLIMHTTQKNVFFFSELHILNSMQNAHSYFLELLENQMRSHLVASNTVTGTALFSRNVAFLPLPFILLLVRK